MFHKEFITLKRRSQIGYGEGKFSANIIDKASSFSIFQNAKFYDATPEWEIEEIIYLIPVSTEKTYGLRLFCN